MIVNGARIVARVGPYSLTWDRRLIYTGLVRDAYQGALTWESRQPAAPAATYSATNVSVDVAGRIARARLPLTRSLVVMGLVEQAAPAPETFIPPVLRTRISATPPRSIPMPLVAPLAIPDVVLSPVVARAPARPAAPARSGSVMPPIPDTFPVEWIPTTTAPPRPTAAPSNARTRIFIVPFEAPVAPQALPIHNLSGYLAARLRPAPHRPRSFSLRPLTAVPGDPYVEPAVGRFITSAFGSGADRTPVGSVGSASGRGVGSGFTAGSGRGSGGTFSSGGGRGAGGSFGSADDRADAGNFS